LPVWPYILVLVVVFSMYAAPLCGLFAVIRRKIRYWLLCGALSVVPLLALAATAMYLSGSDEVAVQLLSWFLLKLGVFCTILCLMCVFLSVASYVVISALLRARRWSNWQILVAGIAVLVALTLLLALFGHSRQVLLD